MLPSPDEIMHLLSPYAYDPWVVYGLVILLLTASSFGLPIPEEVTLISAGVIAYLGLHPQDYPPPFVGAEPVNPWVLSAVCFFAVLMSDMLVFFLGRFARNRADRAAIFNRLVPEKVMTKIAAKTERYGALMAGVFRFTPGLRFPGHFACGFLGVAPWKFIAVDGSAALLSVPTQVLLISFYGEEILSYLKQFKLGLAAVFLVLIGAYVFKRIRQKRKLNAAASSKMG